MCSMASCNILTWYGGHAVVLISDNYVMYFGALVIQMNEWWVCDAVGLLVINILARRKVLAKQLNC